MYPTAAVFTWAPQRFARVRTAGARPAFAFKQVLILFSKSVTPAPARLLIKASGCEAEDQWEKSCVSTLISYTGYNFWRDKLPDNAVEGVSVKRLWRQRRSHFSSISTSTLKWQRMDFSAKADLDPLPASVDWCLLWVFKWANPGQDQRMAVLPPTVKFEWILISQKVQHHLGVKGYSNGRPTALHSNQW